MIESPLQILRERVAGNITKIANTLRSPTKWVAFIVNLIKKKESIRRQLMIESPLQILRLFHAEPVMVIQSYAVPNLL